MSQEGEKGSAVDKCALRHSSSDFSYDRFHLETADTSNITNMHVTTNLRIIAVRMSMRMTISARLFPIYAMLARRPGAPRAPASVDGVGEHRTLGDLLMPMIRQVILLRCLRALHKMLVPPTIRLLGVQARLTAPMAITLNSGYAKRRKTWFSLERPA
jgi:hypothetical protein